MRLFTLNSLYEFMNTVKSGAAPVNDPRFRELLRVAIDLDFISGDSNYKVTERGLEFLNAVGNGDSETLHEIFVSSLEPYKRVYELMAKGVTKPSDIIKLTGYNAVIVDLALRLISEVEGVGKGPVVNEEFYSRFESVLPEKYRLLSRRRWSRYVPIQQLLNEIKSELYVPSRLMDRLFEEFVRRWRDKVVLTGAPGATKGSVEVFGKRYVYIMISLGD
jgi:hypothetical protein